MTERRERIPADEVKESKRWNLPFWTEPNHLVHSDEQAEDVIVEDEELELEPLTAEQLEVIRQDAFNEGLEQGLVEGRQKGEKLGHEEGHQTGLKQGQEEGRKLGFDSGFAEGEKKSLKEGHQKNEANNQKLQTLFTDFQQQLAQQKQILTDNIPDIVLTIAKAVVTQELSQGSEHIVGLVQQALDALPLDSGEFKIEVNPDDLPFIEAAIKQEKFEGTAHANSDIAAGGCRVNTRYSAVDFTLSERWSNIEKQYQRQLQLGSNSEIEYDEDYQETTEQAQVDETELEGNALSNNASDTNEIIENDGDAQDISNDLQELNKPDELNAEVTDASEENTLNAETADADEENGLSAKKTDADEKHNLNAEETDVNNANEVSNENLTINPSDAPDDTNEP